MLGAIAGDIIGSVYEHNPIKKKEFPLFADNSKFTDDTVTTIAIAEALMTSRDYASALREFGRQYPDAGYGKSFMTWLAVEGHPPYGSYGNGSTMRVSPIGWAFNTLDGVLQEAKKSAVVSHNHPEGIRGAQAVAVSVYLARTADKSKAKSEIKSQISTRFGYDLSRSLDKIRPTYSFEVSCQGSVPESIICFLESNSYEDAVRNAVSLGGDSDTMACIAGAIAEAYYGVPLFISATAQDLLPEYLVNVAQQFVRRYQLPAPIGQNKQVGYNSK